MLLTIRCPILTCILFLSYIYMYLDINKVILLWGSFYTSASRCVLGVTFWYSSFPAHFNAIGKVPTTAWEHWAAWELKRKQKGKDSAQTERNIRRMEIEKKIYRPRQTLKWGTPEFPCFIFKLWEFKISKNQAM